jgi:hypothetical protein
MENIFNPETLENFGETLEKKAAGLSANTFLCAAAGALLLAATLKIAGKDQAGSFFGKWAIPLLAIGCYKKFSDSSVSNENGENENNDPEDQNTST